MRRALVPFLLVPMILPADTIRLADHTSWNGVVTFEAGDFIVTVANGQPRRFSGAFVEQVEFNDRDSNPGPLPEMPRSRDAQSVRVDVVGRNQKVEGRLEAIDRKYVKVSGKSNIERSDIVVLKVIRE